MHEIRLKRTDFTSESTIGELKFGSLSLYTLEDPVRDHKVPGKTAIPAGRYEIQITWSPRFGKDLPLLLNVPNFSGIRIHSGNDASHTEGCILVGMTKQKDWINRSKEAYLKLYSALEEALKEGKVWIDISGKP